MILLEMNLFCKLFLRFHQSLALKERGTIITTPYKDPASHLIVVTIAQALYQEK